MTCGSSTVYVRQDLGFTVNHADSCPWLTFAANVALMTGTAHKVPTRYLRAEIQRQADLRRKTTPPMEFTATVSQVRKALKISLRTMADDLGVSFTLLSHIENGKRTATPELTAAVHDLLLRRIAGIK